MLDFREPIIHGSSSFPIAFYHIDKQHVRYTMNFHWHPEFELIRILEGQLHLRLGSNSYIASAGDLFLLPGGTFHAGVPSECVYECIVFNIEALMPEQDRCRSELKNLIEGKIVPLHPLFPIPFLQHTANQLFEAAAEEESSSALTIKGLLFSFLGEFLRNEDRLCSRAVTTFEKKRHDTSVKNVITYIEQNYSDTIFLDTLADIAGMSPNYFCRFFKKVTGLTPIEYLISYRIDFAAYQLVFTDLSVTDIAFQCGFNDISYFINAFKKSKKKTPLQYRSAHRK